MIRNVISAAILLAALVSMASLVNIASAVEPELNLDISAYEGSLATATFLHAHPFAWTPDISQQQRIIKLYESLVLPNSVDTSGFANQSNSADQSLFSFEIYQGDGLDDLRQKSTQFNRFLPDEDTEAYGVSVKQRF